MRMMNHRLRHSSRRRGSVMIEFALCMPILGFFLALTFFFGWSMLNQQNVKAVARYTAWRHVQGQTDLSALDANKNFFNNAADDNHISIGYGEGTDATLQDYVTEVTQNHQPAGALAEKLALETFPKGCQSQVDAEFPTSVRLWQQFQGSITGSRGREGVEWRRGQAELMRPLTDEFLNQLDSTLNNIPGSGRPLGQMVRSLYLAYW
jgi:Flp pilus assembly protein TadG